MQANIASEADCGKMVQTAVDTYGRLDVLHNHAGILHPKDGPAGILLRRQILPFHLCAVRPEPVVALFAEWHKQGVPETIVGIPTTTSSCGMLTPSVRWIRSHPLIPLLLDRVSNRLTKEAACGM